MYTTIHITYTTILPSIIQIELINLFFSFLHHVISSSEISEESELQLTTKMNEVIKQRWVALGPRNYGKSIEWKLEGEPWDTEGLYADHTRGIYLLCLLLEAIQPLGWRLVSSAGKRRSLLQHHLGLRRGLNIITRGQPRNLGNGWVYYELKYGGKTL